MRLRRQISQALQTGGLQLGDTLTADGGSSKLSDNMGKLSDSEFDRVYRRCRICTLQPQECAFEQVLVIASVVRALALNYPFHLSSPRLSNRQSHAHTLYGSSAQMCRMPNG